MPINLQGSGNIAEGWGAPPKLDAPNISGVLGEILQQRRYQEALTQKNIAGAIKQMQEQRQNQAYLEAMQKAGILPEGDYGALGAEGASDLAKQILAKKVADARMEHLLTTGRGRGRGGGSGGGSEATQVEVPEDYYGLSVAPGIPTTKTINGIIHVKDTHGNWKPGPKWMQQGAGQDGTAKPTDIAKAVKERMGLQDQFDTLESDRKKQEAADITAGAKDPNYPQKVPFKQSDLYNLTRNRLKQLEAIPGMPSTAPQGTPQPAPAETGDALPTSKPQPTTGGADKNLATGYGTDATSMSSDDVRAAYRAGKMTIEEAKARLKAMGFSD